MPCIASISTLQLPYEVEQRAALLLAKELFRDSFGDVERYCSIFTNAAIEKRYFSVPLEWFQTKHSLKDRNDLYIQLATSYGVQAIQQCLEEPSFLSRQIEPAEIEAIFFISSSGIATPSMESRIMNQLPFSPHTKRIPIWGLGCAGGASGLSRAYDYCLAYPRAKVLVVCIELCSLTFQRGDQSKSNFVGSALFADGVACALVVGDEVDVRDISNVPVLPYIRATQSMLMANSEGVMGWSLMDDGLHVVFSKDIPSIVKQWVKPQLVGFLASHQLGVKDIQLWVTHPGGKKVLDAYQEALQLDGGQVSPAKETLRDYGNMSSATVLYVCKRVMQEEREEKRGLITALGPGFSSESLLVEWQAPNGRRESHGF